jgi:coenzyme F420-reducing hydrogenase delta subunit
MKDLIKELEEVMLDIVRIQPNNSPAQNAETIMKIINQLQAYEK